MCRPQEQRLSAHGSGRAIRSKDRSRSIAYDTASRKGLFVYQVGKNRGLGKYEILLGFAKYHNSAV